MARKRDTRQGGLFIEYKTDTKAGSATFGKSIPKSENWVAQYYVNGQRFRKSTGTAVKTEAETILRDWMSESERGLKAKPQTQGLTYENIRDAYVEHATRTQMRSLATHKDGTRYFGPQTALDEFFKGRKVNAIDRDLLGKFTTTRQAARVANKTINGSLGLLRTMFQHAKDSDKITTIPKFDLLPWKSRQGFLPVEAFQKLFDAMPAHLRPLLLLLYTTGVRVGEAGKIQWTAVNLNAATITLLEGETKNDEARNLPLVPVLVEMLTAVKVREGEVFPSKWAMQHAWHKACKAAGISGLLIHDLRRSAVRNMMATGAQQAEAMKISGHKDASAFQRYNIIATEQSNNVMARVAKLVPVKLTKALPPKSATPTKGRKAS
jgi:integrase